MLAGGRYNSLSRQYIDRDVAAIGWAAGIDRLALLLQNTKSESVTEHKPIIVIASFIDKNESEYGPEIRQTCYKL